MAMSSKSSETEPEEDPTTVRAPLPPPADAAGAGPAAATAAAAARHRTWPRRTLFGAAALGGVGLGVGAFWWGSGPANGPSPATTGSSDDPWTPVLTATTARGVVTARLVADGVVRLQVVDPEQHPWTRHSYAVEQDLPPLPAQLDEQPDSLTLITPELRLTVDRTSGAVRAVNTAEATIIEESPSGFRPEGQGFSWQVRLPDDETCHGLGQRAFPLSLRHRRLALWNYDARSYQVGADPLYLSVPFYLGRRPGLSYGLFWDNPARASVDLDSDNNGLLTYSCTQRPLTLYLIVGDGPQQVTQRYTGLTGRMELPPLWALGYHQSRWGYRDEADFRRVATRMRKERIPCDALHLDIDYMSGYRVFTWDDTRFPKPAKLLSDLAEDGFKAVAIVDPGIKADEGYGVYRQAREAGLFLTAKGGGRLRREVWPGLSEFPDFTAPACRDWWAGQVGTFAAAGVAGLWNDMNEPSTFVDSRTLPDEVPHDWEGQGPITHGDGGHNVYGMQMARASRDGLAGLRPDKRPFVISRAGYAGLQRYATTWNGDSLATWEHLQVTLPQLLNLSISGVPFSGSDAGGFRGDPGAELYLRWMQLASMTPFFRTHSARTAEERNPWSFGAELTDRIRDVIEFRYRLLPYLYTLARRASLDGTPIARPMFFEDPESTALRQLDDQFMLGGQLLVAPILSKGARSRKVALPDGDWYRLNAGTVIHGGVTITEAAGLGLPLFVRGGTVFPLWPVRQTTDEAPDLLTLQVYAGNGGGELYEDAGDGYGYRAGQHLLRTFTTGNDGGRLTVSCTSQGEFSVPYARIDVAVHGLDAAHPVVAVDGRPVEAHLSDGVVLFSCGAFHGIEVTH